MVKAEKCFIFILIFFVFIPLTGKTLPQNIKIFSRPGGKALLGPPVGRCPAPHQKSMRPLDLSGKKSAKKSLDNSDACTFYLFKRLGGQ